MKRSAVINASRELSSGGFTFKNHPGIPKARGDFSWSILTVRQAPGSIAPSVAHLRIAFRGRKPDFLMVDYAAKLPPPGEGARRKKTFELWTARSTILRNGLRYRHGPDVNVEKGGLTAAAM